LGVPFIVFAPFVTLSSFSVTKKHDHQESLVSKNHLVLQQRSITRKER
jgi:hypothetical protein